MTIGLSIKRIAEGIYARSALDAAARGIDTPAVFTRQHAKALRRVIVDSAASVVASLGSALSATNIGEVDAETDDVITLEYAIEQHQAAIACLRTNIETAIVCATMARATASTDINLSKWYESLGRLAGCAFGGRVKRYG